MKKLGKILFIAFLVLIMGTAWAVSDYIIPHSWKYKITIAVKTPEGVVMGSSVRKISARLGIRLMPEVHPIQYDVEGEAIVVDLGERGVLFGTISSGSYGEVEGAFPYHGSKDIKKIKYYDGLDVGETAKLPIGSWPQMVTFTDMDDPKTVVSLMSIHRCYSGLSMEERAKCDESGLYISDNKMEDIFGKGVSLKSVTVEITDEPVTRGVVDQYLPWLERVGGYLDGKFSGGGPELSNILHGGNFRKGMKK